MEPVTYSGMCVCVCVQSGVNYVYYYYEGLLCVVYFYYWYLSRAIIALYSLAACQTMY